MIPWEMPELRYRLEVLAQEPLTSKQIAEKLGEEFKLDISRNAVIGYMRRNGLLLHFEPKYKPGTKAKVKKPGDRMVKLRVDAPIAPAEAVRPAEAGLLTIYQLQTGDCRWPMAAVMDPPPFMYCGKPALFEKPYCKEHAKKAHQPTSRMTV